MTVKIIEEKETKDLEKKVQKYLNKFFPSQIMEIKYQILPSTYSEDYYSCMIVTSK